VCVCVRERERERERASEIKKERERPDRLDKSGERAIEWRLAVVRRYHCVCLRLCVCVRETNIGGFQCLRVFVWQ